MSLHHTSGQPLTELAPDLAARFAAVKAEIAEWEPRPLEPRGGSDGRPYAIVATPTETP